MRTSDTSYGADYWNSLDGGAGCQDSLMWSDIGHVLHEMFGIDRTAKKDMACDMSFMDVGCGYGFLVRHMRRRGYNSRGLDFSDYALAHAPEDVRPYLSWFDLTQERKWIDQFHTADEFDIVTCFETMEHIPEDSVKQALTHIRTLLKSDGYAVFGICTETRPGWDSDPTHVTIKSREWWAEQISAAGLRNIPTLIKDISRWWLFAEHDGVFVCRAGA